MVRHTIWDEDIDMEDWADDMPEIDPEQFGDMSREELLNNSSAYYRAMEENYRNLDDERANLNIDLDTPIIIIMDLGLWDGRKQTSRIIGTGNIADCLQSMMSGSSTCHWYLDEHGDLCCRESHHDGINYYTYRAIKPTESDLGKRIDTIQNAIRRNALTTWQRTHYTYRLGDRIAAVYGWKINQRGYRRKEA